MTKEAGCKPGLLLEAQIVKAPLVAKKRLEVLSEGWWKALKLEPFGVGCLEQEEVTSFAWKVGGVHVGVEENAEVGGKLELVKCENVVAIGGRCVRVLQQSSKMITRTGEVSWIWWGVEGLLPYTVVV